MKRTVITIIGIVIVVITGYLLTIRQPQTGVSIVHIGSFSRAIDYAPYYIARFQGWFEEVAEKYGATVEYTEFQSLPPINEALATDNIDIVFEAEPPAIVGRSAGIDLRIKGVGVSLIQEIVVPAGSSVQTIQDLKGKKIAVAAGSSSHYGVRKILENSGVSPDEVEILDMSPPDAKAAFAARQIDAWAVWPPFVEQEEVSGNGRVLRGGDVFIQSIITVRGKFADENPELTNDLLDVISRAQNWILENESEAQQIVAETLDLDLAVVQLAWPKHNFKPRLGEKEIADIQDKADFLFEVGLIKNKVDVADLIELDE